jgi:hypothetical protein
VTIDTGPPDKPKHHALEYEPQLKMPLERTEAKVILAF